AFLAGLAVVGGIVFYFNVLSSPEGDTRKAGPKATPAAGAAPGVVSPVAPPNIARPKTAVRGIARDFKPTLKFRPEDRPNFTTIDPTLRLDLLAKVQAADVAGGSRSIFQFSAAPPPPPDPKTTTVAVIHPAKRVYGPEPPPKATPPAPPPAPPPPPP